MKPSKNTHLEEINIQDMVFGPVYLIETNIIEILNNVENGKNIKLENTELEEPWKYKGRFLTGIYPELQDDEYPHDDWNPDGNELDFEQSPIGGLFVITESNPQAPNVNNSRINLLNDSSRFYKSNKQKLLDDQASRQHVTHEVQEIIKGKTGKQINLTGELLNRNKVKGGKTKRGKTKGNKTKGNKTKGNKTKMKRNKKKKQ